MKTMLCIAFFMAFGLLEYPTSVAENGELKVEFKNVNAKNKGEVHIALYNSKETFLTPNFFKSSIVEVKEGSFTVQFKDIPFGTYAVSAYHDINGNQQMDFNENGMPIEDYAMSGTPNQMGPPNWEEVKFEFEKDAQTINVNF